MNNDRDRVVIGRVVVALAGGESQRPAGANAVSAGGASPRFPPPVPPPPLSPHTGAGEVKAEISGLQVGMQVTSTLFLRAWLGSAPRLGGVPSFALPTLHFHFRHYWHFWLLCFTHSWHSGRLHSGILGFLVSLFAAFLVFDFRHSWNSWFFISGIHGHSCLTILGNLGRASG